MPLSVISLLTHAYIAWRLVPALAEFAWLQIGVALLVVLSAISLQVGLSHWRNRRQARRRGHDVAMMAAFVAMGFLSSLFVLTLLRDVALVGVWIASQLGLAISISTFAAWSALAVAAAATLMTVWGLINARRTARVVAVDVPIANLPASLHGFTIAQISDIHVGPTIKGDYVQSIVGAVNRLQADMVAVTGDLVDGSVAQLRSHVAPLSGLTSRHGTYFVTGNHEYYSGVTAWVAELRRLGVKVLLNEHVVLQHNDSALVIAGVTDHSGHHFDESHRSDPAAAIATAPDSCRAHSAGASAEISGSSVAGGISVAALRPHARRAILAVEFLRSTAAAVHCWAGSSADPLGLYESRDRILGPAETIRCTVRDHTPASRAGLTRKCVNGTRIPSARADVAY